MIRETLERIYPNGDFDVVPPVLHTAAVCRDERGNLCVLRVEAPSAPRSNDDRFILGIARARADAIITTGANLRAEPRLSHRLHGDDATAAAMREWSGREPARVYILTASGALPIEHRVFSETPSPMIVTAADGARRLRERGFDESRLVIRKATSIRDTVAYAQSQASTKTVLIEGGPSAARELYIDHGLEPDAGLDSHSVLVDELMLSICEDHVPAEAVGPRLFDTAIAERALADRPRRASGWSFYRLFPRRLSGGFLAGPTVRNPA